VQNEIFIQANDVILWTCRAGEWNVEVMHDGNSKRVQIERKNGTAVIDELKEVTGINIYELNTVSNNRVEWRRLVKVVTRGRLRSDGTR